MLSHAPRFDAETAARVARDLYGRSGTVRALTSERDQNFLLETASGERLVLKIANALEDPALLDAQQQAMRHIGATLDLAPRVIPALQGSTLSVVEQHCVWAVSHLPGAPLGLRRRRSQALLSSLGAEIGALTAAFRGFDHPAIHRDFYWDLARGRAIVAQYRPLIDDPELGAAIDTLMARFDREAAPLLAHLPRSAIHGDLNDFNVLVDGDHVSGFVDFGDMVFGYTVGDLAIAAAYAMLDADDPVSVLSHTVSGYQSRCALTETEGAVVFPLATLRLCTSACVAAHQQRERPDNAYLGISQAAIRRTLPRLARIPLMASARVVSWLATQRFAPIMDMPSREWLDLSVGGVTMDGITAGIGRWDEPRLIYTAPFFAGRTIHLGIDIFAAPGTPVHAPLRGHVHAFADNAQPQDYGPVIIVRHETDDGTPFYTLYGHLSRASLAHITVGQSLNAGDRIGTLGAREENGHWAPHLHLQLIVDLLDKGTDFPGVGTPAQRDVWRTLSPDPSILAG